MTTAGARPSSEVRVARQTATPVGEPRAMARTATLSARNRGWNIRVEPAQIDGKPVMLSPPFPARGTWNDGRGISRACGTLNRAGGGSVLLVVEQASGPVSTRSGAVIRPRNRMPLTPLTEPPKP